MDRMLVGAIGKAQGIKGEVRVNLNTDNNDGYKSLTHAYIGDVAYDIESVKVLVNGVFIKFKGVDDRNTAESLVNKSFYVDRKNAVKPAKDRYYIVDLIGCDIVGENGTVYGKLTEILQHGAADVYVVKGGECDFMFPAIRDVILTTDIVNKVITVCDTRLKETSVYAD